MRVLITVPWPERLGGAEAMLWQFLQDIDTSRIQPTVVFFEHGPFETEVATLPGVETAVVAVSRLRQPRETSRAVLALARVMRRQRPDLVLSWAASAHIYAALAALQAQGADRLVWWQHAIPSGHRMERAATLLPALAVGCSSTVAAAAQARMHPRRRTFVIHPGAEPRQVTALPRARLGIPRNRIVVGIVGRLQPWKGQHRVVRAIASLRAAGYDVHGLIVGGDAHGLSPEYAPELESLIAETGLGDAVTMTGQVADPLPYVAAMDILVNASDAEPFGIVLIEGMSQGVAVVAARDGGARDIIDHGVSGLLVERPDEALLTNALRSLIDDPERRALLAAAGRRAFDERFTSAAMTRQLQDQLEALTRSRPSRTSTA